MSAPNRWQKRFRKFLGIEFGGVIFRAEITQGIAHHLARVGVASSLDFASDELLPIFRQRYLHACIFKRSSQRVNASGKRLIEVQDL